MSTKKNKSSSKSRDKKALRKQKKAELAKIWAVIEEANKCPDPMEHLVAFRHYTRNGLNAFITCTRSADLPLDDLQWAFELTKANMKDVHERNEWKWNDREKRDEMQADNARYIIARNEDKKPLGFLTFQFDLGDDDVEVGYCYEVQVEADVRRKGLGKFLVQILELIGHRWKMKKIVCTVFKENRGSMDFFTKKLRYETDVTSPSVCDPMNADEYSYEILSKQLGGK
ncbi:N-alpha-acetyltransferase 40-like isoform X2 [Oscarella lobularis]|uniref:N-alpha-acetyltransferase 40-like isoform X2 n=1 Tax=Oscarella lobularis TaxID=121494 RepID=UPI003313F1BF